MGDAGSSTPRGLSRRALLKRGAVAGGAAALVWTAPSIEHLGFAPAGAQTQGTGTIIDSQDYTNDKNSNDKTNNDCTLGGIPPCCGQGWGNSGSGFDEWAFGPSLFTGCNSVVVRLTSSANCSKADPDIAQSQIFISSQDAGCHCQIYSAVIRHSNGSLIEEMFASGLPTGTPCGASASFDISHACLPAASDARLGVKIRCFP